MARRFGRRNEEGGDIWNVILGLGFIGFLYLVTQFFANFWRTLIYGAIFLAIVLGARILYSRWKYMGEKQKVNNILDTIKKAGLDEYIQNFIARFGLGQEKSKTAWQYRNYSVDWYRINDLISFLKTKGINFTLSDINVLMRHYIDETEYKVTSDSIKVTVQSFSKLSGSDFEGLLYRLYQAMGYSVQHSGKVGDQGGDLVATKDQERVLIQAKCYNNTVGNSAVQEAVAAKSYYGCNKAMVIATNDFTREAIELAKTNGVELIPKMVLQKMLLDYLKESWD